MWAGLSSDQHRLSSGSWAGPSSPQSPLTYGSGLALHVHTHRQTDRQQETALELAGDKAEPAGAGPSSPTLL